MTKSPDMLDNAQHLEELERTNAIRSMKRHGNVITPTGECHWCEAEIDDPKLFCDNVCAARWSRENEHSN